MKQQIILLTEVDGEVGNNKAKKGETVEEKKNEQR
jgi:hypothetical protein